LLKKWAPLWKGIPSVLHRCGKRREPLGACYDFYGHLTESGSLKGAAKRSRITQGEHSRVFEGRGRQSSVTTSNCQRLTDVRKSRPRLKWINDALKLWERGGKAFKRTEREDEHRKKRGYFIPVNDRPQGHRNRPNGRRRPRRTRGHAV
jgi:hypothetical protein